MELIKSEQIGDLAAALCKAQAEMPVVKYDAENPFFQSGYATLAHLIEQTKPILAKNNLAVCQTIGGEGGVTTLLLHTSGQYIGGHVTLKPVKDDPQGRGSAITYARRYSYAAILALAPDKDDDANAASQPEKQTEPKQAAKSTTYPARAAQAGKPAAKPISQTDDQLHKAELTGILQTLNPTGDPVQEKELMRKWTSYIAKEDSRAYANKPVGYYHKAGDECFIDDIGSARLKGVWLAKTLEKARKQEDAWISQATGDQLDAAADAAARESKDDNVPF